MNRRTTTKPDQGLLKLTPGVTVASHSLQVRAYKPETEMEVAARQHMGKLVGNSTQRMKPKYSELVKALDRLRRQVDGLVLNACSAKEIRDSYSGLCSASVHAEKLVNRARRGAFDQ